MLTCAVILAVAAAAATAAAGGSPPGVAGVRRGMGGVTALPTRRYCPPKSKRFMEETASCADWALSYSTEETGRTKTQQHPRRLSINLPELWDSYCVITSGYLWHKLSVTEPKKTTTTEIKTYYESMWGTCPHPSLSPVRHVENSILPWLTALSQIHLYSSEWVKQSPAHLWSHSLCAFPSWGPAPGCKTWFSRRPRTRSWCRRLTNRDVRTPRKSGWRRALLRLAGLWSVEPDQCCSAVPPTSVETTDQKL